MGVFIAISKGILEQGLIYSIMALGVYISYHVLDFPDLSVDGTFPLGAAITAVLILQGVNPWLACLLAFMAGGMAGLVTGLLHVKLKITDLLSGILTMTALWSVNLAIAKTSLLSTYGAQTIFNSGPILLLPASLAPWRVLILVLILALLMKFLLDWYLTTRSGMLLRAVGDNPQLVISLAKNPGYIKIVGLIIGNGFAALSGAILCQQQRFFDVNMGAGMIVMGLASVIIGMTVFKKLTLINYTSMVLWGSILYKAALSIALNLGFDPNYLKLIMAILFTIALVSNNILEKKKGGAGHMSLLELINIDMIFNLGTVNETKVFRDFNLSIEQGQFISVVGSNGSGKTTLLNLIAGNLEPNRGAICFAGQDIKNLAEYERSQFIGRVFQDPAKGTSPSMTILENMALADHKGLSYGLQRGVNKKRREYYRSQLEQLHLGLEDKLDVLVGSLSGGQRQALALLICTLTPIKLLILDEHTAALDPKTSETIMELTNKIVQEKQVTALMVTHNLRYAVEFGNRLLMMNKGKAVIDVQDEVKEALDTQDLVHIFSEISIELGN